MSKTLVGIGIMAVLMAFGAGSAIAADNAAKPAKPNAADPAQIMKQLDADKDGTISKAEAEKMKGLTEIFDTADETKDGKLDAAELNKALGGMPQPSR
jgi:Ca2+-binding EF-hand superfamily protein